jgi:hypothetical protein
MKSFEFVLTTAVDFIPGLGRVLDAGLDMLATASQIASFMYPDEEDPEGAFNWWLSPCGGTDMVPDDIKKVFDVLNSIPSGISSFKEPKNLKKGSGKKGDDGNPRAPTKPRPGGGTTKPTGNNGVKKKCNIKAGTSKTRRLGGKKNTLRLEWCDSKDTTQTSEVSVRDTCARLLFSLIS